MGGTEDNFSPIDTQVHPKKMNSWDVRIVVGKAILHPPRDESPLVHLWLIPRKS
jgi:hypothetical protein